MRVRRMTLFLLSVIGLTACDGAYRVIVPYCPISDSAWAHADSVPLGCLLPDTLTRLP